MKMKIERFGLPYNPKQEKKDKNKIIRHIALFLVVFIIVAVLLTIGIELSIRRSISCLAVQDSIDSTWIGSLASYWGGIIGGMISGVLAFIGVFYTIRYYKESDEQKEKASIQPFLYVKAVSEKRVSCGFSLGKEDKDKKSEKRVDVSVQNIGNGFANTLVICTEANLGGVAFNNVITVGDFVNLFFMVDESRLEDGIHFGIQYIDSMRNEYIQEYIMKEEYGSIKIECGYPGFLEQS